MQKNRSGVYASKFDSIPIGVIDFRSTNGQKINEEGKQPWKIIASDLILWQVYCNKSWRLQHLPASVGIYIDGEYTVEGSQISVNCYLRDAASKELIIGKNIKVS